MRGRQLSTLGLLVVFGPGANCCVSSLHNVPARLWGFIGFVRRHNPEKDLGFADTHNTLRIEEGGMGSQERDGLPGKTGEVSGPDLAPAFFAAGDTVRRG